MRLGLYVIRDVIRLRKNGNKRAYISVELKSFIKGYNLFVPLMKAEIEDVSFPVKFKF